MESPSRPRVTIGLPVYNGESTLQGCLENLESQTFQDFKVVIRDNASTDLTEEIARKFVEKDDRFQYVRNEKNNGPAQNFLDALNAADTEYFLWRADDDLAAPDFLECMVAKLDNNPDAVLSVAHVESRRPSRGRVKNSPYVVKWPGPRLLNVIRQMFYSHASWIYGVWRTSYIQQRYLDIWHRYPDLWANDHLVILGPILDGQVTGRNTTRFIQQIGVRRHSSDLQMQSGTTPKAPNHVAVIENNLESSAKFQSVCREEIQRRQFPPVEKAILTLMVAFYAKKRTGSSLERAGRLKIKRWWNGISPAKSR